MKSEKTVLSVRIDKELLNEVRDLCDETEISQATFVRDALETHLKKFGISHGVLTERFFSARGDIDEYINEFIKDKELIDIKYTTSIEDGSVVETALVLYKNIKK